MKQRPVVVVAEEILLENGHPLHYREITRMLINQCNLSGKTPHQSVRTMLAISPKFKKVAEGVFGLAIWRQYPAIRFAKDIAYDILSEKGAPMGLTSLGEKIFFERKFTSRPRVIVRNVINSDKRFYYDANLDQIGLVEWKKK